MKKAIGIIILGLLLGALSSCDSPQEDCYKKVYKMWKKRGHDDGTAAQNAKSRCY